MMLSCNCHQEVQTALEKFSPYHIIWLKDREEDLIEFMKDDPKLSEFETQIIYYEELEQQILAEPEHYEVGPIALYTGQFVSSTNDLRC